MLTFEQQSNIHQSSCHIVTLVTFSKHLNIFLNIVIKMGEKVSDDGTGWPNKFWMKK